MVDFIKIAQYSASTDMVDSYYWICKALSGVPSNTMDSSSKISCTWYRYHLMVVLSKRACLYVLMCAAYNLVWTQEKICLRICLRLCLQLCWGGPIHLHHPLYSHQNSHSWCFFHSWDFYRHFSILWLRWLDTTVSFGIHRILCNHVLVNSMAPVLQSGVSYLFIPRCYF